MTDVRALRTFDSDIEELRLRFTALHELEDVRKRGYDFEALLNDQFKLFDLEPRLGYRTATEQIDGSLTFDNDDYIVEAKWTAPRVDRETLDVFDAKVRRKGKNALGMFVSVSGFTGPALEAYAERTSFVTFEGSDLYLVLERRVRLDELLRDKRRHANETGSCYWPAHLLS